MKITVIFLMALYIGIAFGSEIEIEANSKKNITNLQINSTIP